MGKKLTDHLASLSLWSEMEREDVLFIQGLTPKQDEAILAGIKGKDINMDDLGDVINGVLANTNVQPEEIPVDTNDDESSGEDTDTYNREPGDDEGEPKAGIKKLIPNFSGIGDWFKSGGKSKLIWIAVIVILFLITGVGVIYYFNPEVFVAMFTPGPGGFSPEPLFEPNTQAPANPEWSIAPPTMAPLDFLHATRPTVTHVVILTCAFLIAIFVLMDALQRREKNDFKWMLRAILTMLISGGLFYLTKQSFFVGFMRFDQSQLRFVQFLYGALFTGLAFTAVIMASTQGRRDWTPFAGLLSSMGATGMLLGTIGLGSLGLMLLLPDSPTLSLKTLWEAFWHKQFGIIWTSLVIYLLLTSGALLLAFEAYRSIKSARDWEKFFSIAGSTLILAIYLGGRALFPGTHPLMMLGLAIGICAVAGGMQQQQERHEAEDSQYGSSPVSAGEVRKGRALIPPYDKLAWQLSALLLIIALTGNA